MDDQLDNGPVDIKDEVLQNQDMDDDDEDVESGEDADADREEDDSAERWIDVKDLKNMTLEELRNLKTESSKEDAERRPELPITKVVVRRLPPLISVEDYLNELSEMPNYNYIRLVPPMEDLPSRIGKRSTIYINFDTEQEAFWFKEKYNNMKFFDERGNSYIACVDFSFIQDVAQDPPEDPLAGTLGESEMFQEFLKAYEEDPWSFTMNRPANVPTPEAMLDEILNKKVTEPESTPLLQFLREKSMKKEAVRKEREQRKKEKEIARRKLKEEASKRRQKEKEELAKRKQKDKEDGLKRKPADDIKDRDKDNHKERRRERDRERQRERDRERRLRKEREKMEREHQQANKTGSGQEKLDLDDKDKSKYAGTVTYSRTGNPTRWSENSGPRKGDKLARDEHKRSQEKLSSSKKASSAEKLAVEKGTSSSQNSDSKTNDAPKSAFGKPFPSKPDNTEKSVSAKKADDGSGDANSKPKVDEGGNKKEGGSDGAGGTKKKVIKRVIKVRKVKENGVIENGETEASGNAQQSGSSESKPKKIIRVVKKVGKSAEDGSNTKSSTGPPPSKKSDGDSKTESKPNSTENVKGDTEKERKSKKGRPEIQIYRPGSLRGGASKPSTASGDKERKSDNNNL